MTVYVNIPDARLVKIVKCLALLASDKQWERLAAADAVLRLLEQYGLTFEQIILAKPITHSTFKPGKTVEEKIGAILANLEALSAWERQFVHSVNGRPVLTEKQRNRVEIIFRKIIAFRAAKNGGRRA